MVLNFKDFFKQFNENMVAASGGVFGDYNTSGSWTPSGTHIEYAAGDNRIPELLGGKKKNRKNGKKTKKQSRIKYYKR